MSHRKKHGQLHHLSGRRDDGFDVAAEDLDPAYAMDGAETDDDEDPDGVGSGWVETITGLTEDHGATDLLINGSHLNKATKVGAVHPLTIAKPSTDASCLLHLKLRMFPACLPAHWLCSRNDVGLRR